MAKLSAVGTIAPALLLTVVNYFVYDLGDDSYFLPFPVMYVHHFKFDKSRNFNRTEFIYTIINGLFSRLPFNWQTPFGYLIALVAQGIAAICTLFSGTLTMSLLVGSCWLFIIIVDDIANDLPKLDSGDYSSQRRRAKVIKYFCNILECYADLKQLSELAHQCFAELETSKRSDSSLP